MVTKKFTCGDTFPSGCIIYTGNLPAFIPASTISCDASVDEVLEKYGEAIDGILDNIDLTGLDPKCFDFEPNTIKLRELEQLQINKICDHEDRISTLETDLGNLDIGDHLIEMDLLCLASDAAPCQTLPNIYTLQSILNVLLQEVCLLKQEIEDCGGCTSGTSGTAGTAGIGAPGTSGVSGVNGTSGSSGSSGTSGQSSAGGTYAITRWGDCQQGQIVSNFDITGFQPGDVVVVRATFSGQMTKVGGNFVRANLSITSPDGSSNEDTSACYSDSFGHSFDLSADSTITILGNSSTVSVTAVVNNSTEAATGVNVSIISVNGNSQNISVPGCRGNLPAGGDC